MQYDSCSCMTFEPDQPIYVQTNQQANQGNSSLSVFKGWITCNKIRKKDFDINMDSPCYCASIDHGDLVMALWSSQPYGLNVFLYKYILTWLSRFPDYWLSEVSFSAFCCVYKDGNQESWHCRGSLVFWGCLTTLKKNSTLKCFSTHLLFSQKVKL